MAFLLRLFAFLATCSLASGIAGSWNGVAVTAWNGIAQTAWNGTAVSQAAGGGSTGLLTNLTCFWKMDEASGNRADLVSSQTLTDNSTVGSGTGLVYATAADLEFSSSEYFSRTDEATISLPTATDTTSDFTIVIWVKLESKDSFDNDIYTKDGGGIGTGTSNEYALYMDNTSFDRYRFNISDGSGTAHTEANNFGSPGLGAWHMIACWHNSTTDLIGISVNAGTANTAAWTGGTQNGTGPLNIGAVVGGARCFDGMIGPAMFWKGRALSGADITLLYNGGAGLPYASW